MTKKLLVLIFIIFLLALAFRSLTPEDTWICQNGQWVKHGNPITAEPSTPCGK
jgi:hypothetical protein